MNFKEIDFISQLPKIWEWLTNIDDWYGFEGWLARIVVWLVIFVLILKLLKYLLNEFLEIRDKWKQAGLPVVRFTPEQIIKIRRRKQFCNVLHSDLATIAKAESWNDQYFTDLEAEIEAEGFYYASNFDRLIRRKSSGLRRESSLIKSIDRSVEQFLLLVGEPGSGKSVAMRHLAHQLTERALRSNSLNEKIPLYINLKELPSAENGKLTPSFIEQFVLENIRRGDADTVDYVREHWDEYREHGIWFFLFDSFDEIPAVMHAPTGSAVVHNYSEAIRQFLASMSSCRGVVASREFKGPETLPWQKFRILPLSPKRQDQLIDNSFLKPDEKQIVRQHLATYSSNIHHSPMFLTLLCRYIKDEKEPPTSDYDLLSRHIERLARRDTEYIHRKYGLMPEILLDGAVRLAVLFAERPDLSLAPTQDDIKKAFKEQPEMTDNLENLLSALIDVKIGRCDVQEARPGDRRFTFAHRRYQEALFVSHLVRHPEHIEPKELLTNSRWREYCVILLQTQPLETLSSILQTARALLEKEYKPPVSIAQELGGHLCYYEWKDDPVVALLYLLQEGFARRISDIPENLANKVQTVLQPRWDNGDEYDRKMVLETGGLLPQILLQEYLGEAINQGAAGMHSSILNKIAFLKKVPEDLVHWARKRLSNEVLLCLKQRQLLQLQALAAYLPEKIEAATVFQRSRRLRTMNVLFRLFASFFHLAESPIDSKFISFYWIYGWTLLCITITIPFRIREVIGDTDDFFFTLAFSSAVILWGVGLLLFVRRTIPRQSNMGLRKILVTFQKRQNIFWDFFDNDQCILSLLFLLFIVSPLSGVYIIKDKTIINVIIVWYTLLFVLLLLGLLIVIPYLRLFTLKKRYKGNILFLFQARSINELTTWIGYKKNRGFFVNNIRLFVDNITTGRCLIRIFSAFNIRQFDHPPCLLQTPLLKQKRKGPIAAYASGIIRRLMQRVEELENEDSE